MTVADAEGVPKIFESLLRAHLRRVPDGDIDLTTMNHILEDAFDLRVDKRASVSSAPAPAMM
eukprot:2461689-Amphidinium_carterae.1